MIHNQELQNFFETEIDKSRSLCATMNYPTSAYSLVDYNTPAVSIKIGTIS